MNATLPSERDMEDQMFFALGYRALSGLHELDCPAVVLMLDQKSGDVLIVSDAAASLTHAQKQQLRRSLVEYLKNPVDRK